MQAKSHVLLPVVAVAHPGPSAAPACLSCSVAKASGAKFCPDCGRALTEPAGVAPVLPLPVEPPPSTNAEPTVQAEAVASLAASTVPASVVPPEPAAAPRICTCGVTLSAEAKYCGGCGTKVAETSRAQYLLVCRRPGSQEYAVPLFGQELTIGKTADCGVALAEDEYVSRRHARLVLQDGQVVLEDLGSANGTFVKIREPVVLDPGDEILVGTSLLRLKKQTV